MNDKPSKLEMFTEVKADLYKMIYKENDESHFELLDYIRRLLTFSEPKDCKQKGVIEMKRNEILHEAEKCVCTDRESTYGSPEDNFKTIANLWWDYLKAKGFDVCLSSKDVAVMMILLKVARIAGKADKLDNWIDIAGYSACGGEIEGLK